MDTPSTQFLTLPPHRHVLVPDEEPLASSRYPSKLLSLEDPSYGIYFVGTATVVVHIGGFCVLTDPTFLHAGDHVHLGYGVVATKVEDIPVTMREVPPIDFVVLSHYHGDHWDPEVERLLNRDIPVITTPHAVAKLEPKGFRKLIALPNLHMVAIQRGQDASTSLTITAIPGRHGGDGVVGNMLHSLGVVPPVMGSLWELRKKQPGNTSIAQAPIVWRAMISGDTLPTHELKGVHHLYPKLNLLLIHLGGTTLPMGVVVTMDARYGVEYLHIVDPDKTKIERILPIHYNDWDVFRDKDVDAFIRAAEEAGWKDRVIKMKQGEYKLLEFSEHRVEQPPATATIWLTPNQYVFPRVFLQTSGCAQPDHLQSHALENKHGADAASKIVFISSVETDMAKQLLETLTTDMHDMGSVVVGYTSPEHRWHPHHNNHAVAFCQLNYADDGAHLANALRHIGAALILADVSSEQSTVRTMLTISGCVRAHAESIILISPSDPPSATLDQYSARHARIEQHLQSLALFHSWLILRVGLCYESLYAQVHHGQLTLPVPPDTPLSLVGLQDVGRLVQRLVRQHPLPTCLQRQTLVLTGPAQATGQEIAQEMSSALHQPVAYKCAAVAMPPHNTALDLITNDFQIAMAATADTDPQSGGSDDTSDDEYTSSLSDYLHQHADEYGTPGQSSPHRMLRVEE
ncbi:hypothetical protein RI367_001784 [Sorochytrium milnesiophthora]